MKVRYCLDCRQPREVSVAMGGKIVCKPHGHDLGRAIYSPPRDK